jgi:hypothetical protein
MVILVPLDILVLLENKEFLEQQSIQVLLGFRELRELRAPKAPKAPRELREPKVLRAPKARREPKALREPREPRDLLDLKASMVNRVS